MLDVTAAAARYPGGPWLFRDLTFRVEDGEFCLVLGPNGTGKTSLLRCILGVQQLATGRVQRPERAAHVPQSLQVLFDFSVLDIVLMGATASRPGLFTLPRRTDYDRAHAALEELGMSDFSARPFASLSGGERQLVLLARAIATGSRLILLDEPTAALDIGNEELVLGVLEALRARGNTVFMTSHDPEHALRIADQVLLMHADGSFDYGPPRTTLTEESLSRLYGVPLRLLQVEDRLGRQMTLLDRRGARESVA